ncbi:malate dehydrogenase, mitochondrial-like [Cylas formicarius]|uniref:malate dehydrogenase, mitochondrial-like n=1 Tax=Cylas formicarius TaxID=197179 RepID=UPI0029583340|nr:malate dehydrogenase, mitochondrial-like [Cylas formicarius]
MYQVGSKLFNFVNGNIRKCLYPLTLSSVLNYSSMKVTIVGAAGKVGQSLCLMLKQSPLIDELCIHDVKSVPALALELNHIDTRCRVCSFSGKDSLAQALRDSTIVVIFASAPDAADFLTEEKIRESNFSIVKEIVTEHAKNCPKALLALGTTPINSVVPMACEILKKHGCYNAKGVFGITSLDTVRASTFVAQVQGLEPECVTVPVIGGCTSETVIPVLSKAKPCSEFTNEEIENITASIRNARQNITKFKPSQGSPMAAAFAAARFIISLVKGIQGYADIIETAFVPSSVHPYVKYLATPLLLGSNGVMKNLGIPSLTDFEQCMFDNAIPLLTSDIRRGEECVGIHDPPPPCDPCAPPKITPCPHDWCAQKNA